MKKVLQLGNIGSVVFAIAANAVTATSQSLPSIGSVSETYATLLTPATYAFSIWTLIFIMISLLALYQARDFFRPQESNDLPQKMSGWFMLANLMNGSWTYVFVQGEIALSVVIILALLFSLLMLIKRLRIATYDASFATIFFVWWAILLYTGWVLVASIVNLTTLGVQFGITLSAVAAAGIIGGLAIILSVLLWKRNVRSLVLASSWGIAAVAVAQYGVTPIVWITATAAVILLVAQTMVHAYQNHRTNPLKKLAALVKND